MRKFQRFILFGCLGATLLVLCSLCTLAVLGTSTYNRFQGDEHSLSTEYLNMTQSLTDYFTKTKGSLGIADRNAGELEKIFAAAMNSSGKDSNFRDPGNVVYQHIQSAYPQVGSASAAYSRVQNILVSSYDDYSLATKKLRDHVRAYRTSIDSFPNNIIAGFLGFPSDRLEVTVKGKTLYRGDALKQMETVINDASASKSIDTGTLEPLFPSPTPTR